MLNLTVIAVGRLNAAYYKQAAAEYEKRLSAFCKVHVIELAEEAIAEKNASPAVIEKALEKEGKAILAAVPKGAVLTALCVEGRQLSSEALAHRLSEWAVSGVSCAAFAIGSSHGLSPQVKQAAALRLSMSEMTFPHQLARVMLLEQLYRACCIQAGKRYHKRIYYLYKLENKKIQNVKRGAVCNTAPRFSCLIQKRRPFPSACRSVLQNNESAAPPFPVGWV